MEQDKTLKFSNYALTRMGSRGVTEAHVWYCAFNQTSSYKVKNQTVWVCCLPDNRNMKIRVEDHNANPIIILDAFFVN